MEYNMLRTPSEFYPRMISTPNPGLPSYTNTVFNPFSGAGPSMPHTPLQYHSPISSRVTPRLGAPTIETQRGVTFTSPSSSASVWNQQLEEFLGSTSGNRNPVSQAQLRDEETQTSFHPNYLNPGQGIVNNNSPAVRYPSVTLSSTISGGLQFPGLDRQTPLNPIVSQETRPSIASCAHYCKKDDVETPTFNGKDKWDTFISLFQKVADYKNWDNTVRCQRLMIALRGSALEFVDTLQLRVTKDYDQLKQALAQRFGIASNEALYRVKFKGRRRNENESLDKYIQDLQYLAERAYPNERGSIYHRLIVEQFVEGIGNRECKNYLQLNLNMCKETDISLVQEVLKYAHNFESVMGGPDRVRKPYEERPTNMFKPSQNDANQQYRPVRTHDNNQNEGRRGPSKIICFKCRKEGHIASRCPLNQEQGNQENGQGLH